MSSSQKSKQTQQQNQEEQAALQSEAPESPGLPSSHDTTGGSECVCCAASERGLCKLKDFFCSELAEIKRNLPPMTTSLYSPISPGNSSYADMARNGKRVAIISDSMCKHIKLEALNQAMENKTAYKRIFLGATPADINHYCVRTLETDHPDITVLHAGTNSLGTMDPFAIAKDLVECVNTCKSHGCNTVFVSGVVDRPDFSEEVRTLNNFLYHWSFVHGYTYIYNENIRSDCLARDKLHLNYKGALRLGANFRRALNKPYV